MREMKDSGIAWIGKIPRKWKIKKIKNIICNDKEGIKIGPFGSALANKTMTDGPYNIYGQANLVNDDFSYTKNTINKSTFHTLKSYQVLPNDICLSMMGTIGKCKTVPIGIKAGIMDSHLIKIRLDKTQILNKFFEYVYDKDLSDICITEMQYVKKGSIMDGLNTSIVKNLRIIIPSVLEQQAIADFLDAKCADIDSLTADIQKQINILKEYKKSVITQAVTKGLDPNVEMKDSGVGWIGMIPSKWNIGKIKSYVDKVGSGKTPKGDNTLYTKGKILFLRSQNVYNTGIILDDPPTVITDAIDKELSNTRVITDDVLLNITGGSIGRCCIYNLEKKANVNQHVSIIRMKKDKMLSGYMHYFWISDLGQTAINLYQTGGNREGMSASAIKNTPIPFMPIWEQQAIIDFLDSKCADIDAIISGKQKQLDVLKEYKKSLIYEYVTGKKEVPCRE